MEEVESAFDRMPPPSGYSRPNTWGASSSPSSSGRTPNPYMSSSGGRTPGQAIAGRTPNPYNSMGGGRTPGWGALPTPNPYSGAGGRTAPWPQAVTPNPSYLGGPSASFGGRTPARVEETSNGWGQASPPGNTSPAWVSKQLSVSPNNPPHTTAAFVVDAWCPVCPNTRSVRDARIPRNANSLGQQRTDPWPLGCHSAYRCHSWRSVHCGYPWPSFVWGVWLGRY